GTEDYMSPEQEQALLAVKSSRPAPRPVDARSDIFSLGLVLYEALGGLPPGAARPPRLGQRNSQVSVGLADIVHKCLAPDPHDRYARAADLSADLRRHLSDQPLRGVRNRSAAERWRKWRRRTPHALKLWLLGLAVLLAGAAVFMMFLGWLAE